MVSSFSAIGQEGEVFDLPEGHPNLLFKGGTTLSKIHKLTKRFSEDIDLSIDRHNLGFEN